MSVPPGSVVHAEILLEGCSGEVCVNGIPVVSCPEALPSFQQSVLASSLVVPHLNVLELAVDLDPEAPSLCRRRRQRALPTSARAIARLTRYRVDSFASPENGDVLAYLEWSSADDQSEASPRELRTTADLGQAFGRWAWQDAPPIVIDDGTRYEVIFVLEQVRSALQRGDVDGLLGLIDLKFREVGRTWAGANDAEDRAQLATWVRQFAAEPDRVLPIDRAGLDLRLAAEGRIVIPTTRSWTSALQLRMPVTDEDGTSRGDVEVPYDVKLARVGGLLRIVR